MSPSPSLPRSPECARGALVLGLGEGLDARVDDLDAVGLAALLVGDDDVAHELRGEVQVVPLRGVPASRQQHALLDSLHGWEEKWRLLCLNRI